MMPLEPGKSCSLLRVVLSFSKALPKLGHLNAQEGQAFQELLGMLGRELQAGRAVLCQVDHVGDTKTACHWYFWSKEEEEPPKPPSLEEIAAWQSILNAGTLLFSQTDQLPEPLAQVLSRQGVQQVLVLPLFVEDAWWGFLRFDDCRLDLQQIANALQLALEILENALSYGGMERSLREAKQRAEESSRLKDKFVALAAHDLRSPLHSILGAIEYVLDDQEAPLAEAHRQLLKAAVQSGRNLLQVTDDVLNIARLHTGALKLEKRFMDAHQVVDEVIRRLDHLAKKKSLRIENQLPHRMRLYGDRMLFGEVVLNLLSNAIKFSYPEGLIRIFSQKDQAGWVNIAIQDQGVGIPEEALPKLFRVEEKVSTPGTRGERGTGFGLPFSYEIMEAHGGVLAVKSAPNQGSTFYIRVPKVVPKILVVDDMPIDRMVMVKNLQVLDVEILEAESGEAALQLIEKHHPHLILSDILMPEMDGFQLVEKINSDPKMKQIPVILVTADQHEETRNRAFSCGAADFTEKPVVPHDLLPRVRHFVI